MMKQITTYIAEDGTTFDNYKDCYDYEFECGLNLLGDQIRLYDDNGTLIDTSITDENHEDVFTRCCYIYLGDDTAARVMDEIGYKYGYSMPRRSGYWYYDETKGWTCLTDKIIKLRKKLACCEKELEMMGGQI